MVDFLFLFFEHLFCSRFLSEKKGCSRVLCERTRRQRIELEVKQTRARKEREREKTTTERDYARVYNYNFFKCILTEKSTRTTTYLNILLVTISAWRRLEISSP